MNPTLDRTRLQAIRFLHWRRLGRLILAQQGGANVIRPNLFEPIARPDAAVRQELPQEIVEPMKCWF